MMVEMNNLMNSYGEILVLDLLKLSREGETFL